MCTNYILRVRPTSVDLVIKLKLVYLNDMHLHANISGIKVTS